VNAAYIVRASSLEGAMSKSLAFVLFLAACGPSAVPDNFGNGGDANGSGGGGGSGGGSGCATSTVSAQVSPLDLYVMLDQSGSMTDSVSGGTKWSTVTAALDSFLTQPGLTGFSVGLQYFGLDGGGFSDSCTASDYATPAVEIAALPGAASSLTTSIGQHSPTTGTPTSAALQGAIDHAKAWATAHTGDVAAVVLATDGDPEECDTNLAHIDAIAAAGWAGTPKVATFVIGVGSSLTNLNGIAAAGGTTSAFIVDTNQNVNAQFLAAMNAIRNAAACTYQIPLPTSGTVDYTQVNIVFTPNGGTATTIPNVANQAACPATGDGWYYDNANAPTSIILCTTTCGSVQSSGTVQITLGCDTVIL
jgi:hypothetical protein